MTMKPDDIAQVCHEANRAYCLTIGDDSQPSWNSAPDWQQDSAINGVEFAIEHPTAPPSASHDSWLEQKRIDGWKYGSVKNPETKEHPCFLPYEKLPEDQQRKDALFQAVVRALA